MKNFIILLLLISLFPACVKNVGEDTVDKTLDCSILETYYTDNLSSIFSSNCTGCHAGATPSGGLDLSSYTTMKSNLSTVLDRVNRDQGSSGFMPQGGPKLSDANLDSLYSFSRMECDE